MSGCWGRRVAVAAASAVLALLPLSALAVSPSPPHSTPSATPTPAPVLSISPAGPFDFGKVPIALTHHQDFTVTWSGNPSGLTTTAAFDGSNPGAFTAGGCAGATSASCVLTVSFTPPDRGAYSASLKVTVSGSQAPTVSVAVSGTGQNPPTVDPTALTFTAADGPALFLPLTINLSGGQITSLAFTGTFIADTPTSPGDCRVTPGFPTLGPCVIRVAAQPGAAPRSGTLTITTDDGSLVVSLQVVAPVASISASPQPLSRSAPFILSGSGLLPSRTLDITWDGVTVGSVRSGANGAISWTMPVPTATSNDGHQLCVVNGPAPVCVTVRVELAVLAAASQSPTPAIAPTSPPASPAAGAAASANGADDLTPVAVITRPPFVFLPIAAVLGLLGLLAWLALRRSRSGLEDATVVHEFPAERQQPAPGAASPQPMPAPRSAITPPVYETPGTPEVEAEYGAAPPAPDGADLPPDLPEPSD